MAEYIDREQLLGLINEDCKYKNPTNEYTRGCNEVCDWAIKTIKNIPTADVVPKSEVDRTIAEWACLHADVLNKLENARTEVAREIFEEIYEDCFDQFGYINYEALAELKKKYTEVAE